ncbi:MAG: indole-3-glycerol phosphate synthase TrpC [Candidatus Binataceae bacterium]
MSSVLECIFAAKRDEVAKRRGELPLDRVIAAAARQSAARDFRASLKSRRPAIIAEIKRASPSKGDIFPGLDPAAVACEYEAAGAAALSVLTDRHFKGSLEDFRAVRAAVNLPLLRKDFIFDSYQIYESRAAGADCVLLIAAMLSIATMRALAELALELGMAALVEAHNRDEFRAAENIGAQLIGLNNRDLHTFDTRTSTTEALLKNYAGTALIVTESGIESPSDIRRLAGSGAHAFLIGESLLRDGAPRAKLGELMHAFDREDVA